MNDEQWRRLRSKYLAQETYAAVEGMYPEPGKPDADWENIDMSDWPAEIRERLQSDAEKLAAEKNIPVETALGVIITSAIRFDLEHPDEFK